MWRMHLCHIQCWSMRWTGKMNTHKSCHLYFTSDVKYQLPPLPVSICVGYAAVTRHARLHRINSPLHGRSNLHQWLHTHSLHSIWCTGQSSTVSPLIHTSSSKHIYIIFIKYLTNYVWCFILYFRWQICFVAGFFHPTTLQNRTIHRRYICVKVK